MYCEHNKFECRVSESLFLQYVRLCLDTCVPSSGIVCACVRVCVCVTQTGAVLCDNAVRQCCVAVLCDSAALFRLPMCVTQAGVVLCDSAVTVLHCLVCLIF